MLEIAGKRVLVTGAASGIGRGAGLCGRGLYPAVGRHRRGRPGSRRPRGGGHRRSVPHLHRRCERRCGHERNGRDGGARVRGHGCIGERGRGGRLRAGYAHPSFGPALDRRHQPVGIRARHIRILVRHGGERSLNAASRAGLAPAVAVVPYTMTKSLWWISPRPCEPNCAAAVSRWRRSAQVSPILPSAFTHVFTRSTRPATKGRRNPLRLCGKSPSRTGGLVVKAAKRDRAVVVTPVLGRLMYRFHRPAPGLFRAASVIIHPRLGRILGMPSGA